MKRLLLTLAISCCFVVLLAACGDNAAPATPPAVPTVEGLPDAPDDVESEAGEEQPAPTGEEQEEGYPPPVEVESAPDAGYPMPTPFPTVDPYASPES